MKEITIEDNGELNLVELNYFGKRFSLIERIRKKGVGSARMTYSKGIQCFDTVFSKKKEMSGTYNYISFELISEGVLLHFNKQQVLKCAALRLDSIITINLYEYEANQNGRFKSAKIEFIEKNETNEFTFVTRDLKQIISYLSRAEFQKKLNYLTTNHSPLDEQSNLLNVT